MVWAVWGTAVGFVASRLGSGWLRKHRLGPSPSERRFWERLQIRRWKDHLPDAGTVFGGSSKRHLPSTGDVTTSLEQYASEIRRAEIVHWIVPAIAPLFFLWNPWWLGVAMCVYALIANVPCLAVQRFNASRVASALSMSNR